MGLSVYIHTHMYTYIYTYTHYGISCEHLWPFAAVCLLTRRGQHSSSKGSKNRVVVMAISCQECWEWEKDISLPRQYRLPNSPVTFLHHLPMLCLCHRSMFCTLNSPLQYIAFQSCLIDKIIINQTLKTLFLSMVTKGTQSVFTALIATGLKAFIFACLYLPWWHYEAHNTNVSRTR